MIRTLFALLFLLFVTNQFCFAQEKQCLSGLIIDTKTEKPIPGVSVMVKGTDIGTISDSAGFFSIDDLPVGKQTLCVSHISYKSKTIKNIEIKSTAKPIELNIKLQSKLHSIKGITVTPSYFSIKSSEPAAQQSLTNNEIATVPQGGDDFFRAISRLPGIGSNDFSARMTIRGGEFGEVLVTLDGLKIYEPFHVKEVDGGAISIIDVAAIDGIDLITGGFGAEYGDKMSGVFNIKSKQIKPGPNKFSAGLSLLNFKTMGEGRFAKNKGSWLISARRGYIDYVLKLTGDDDHVKPTYYDIYSKIDYQFDNNCLISASFLHAGDKLRYNGGDKYDGNFLTSKYGDSYAWLNMSYTPSDKLTINSILSTGKVYYNKLWEVMDKRFVGIDYSVHDKRDYRFAGFKTDWEYNVAKNYLFKVGFKLKRLWSDYDYLHQNYYNQHVNYDGIAYYADIDSTQTILEKSGNQFSVFLTNRIRLTKRLITEVGFRYDYTSYSNDKLFSPRLNAVYELGDKTSIRAGWGHFYQSEGINEIFIGDGETEFYPAEKAEHWVIGLQHKFDNGINFRLEGYYKIYSDLRPEMRNSYQSFDPFPEYSNYRTIFYRAKSYSTGIELFLKKPMGKSISWCISYSNTKAEDSLDYVYLPYWDIQLHENEVLPTPHDQRHTIYFDVGYRPWSSLLINIAWQYHTGWPYTDHKDTTNLSGYTYWGYNGQMNGRHNPFSRVDLRINKYFKIGRGRLTTFIELINVLNRKNVRAYDFDRFISEGDQILEKIPEHWLGLIPSIGLSYQVDF